MSDYERIAKAIAYIGEHVTAQPSLADVAAHVHLRGPARKQAIQVWERLQTAV